MYLVYIVEYERGWGSRVDETIEFKTEKEAKDYIRDYNTKYNSSPVVPDWYMAAEGPYLKRN